MPFQSTVNFVQGFGVIGELFDSGPVRAEPFIVNSADATNNVFGRAFTVVSQGIVQAGNPGGTAVFAGFLVNPKGSTTSGTAAGGSLAPTLTLPNQSNVEILSMGSIIVTLPGAANIGDLVIYNNTTGILATIAPGGSVPGGSSLAPAIVDRFSLSAAGLAVIRVTQVP